MVQVPKVKLNDGREMPIVGLGTYARKAEPGHCRQAIEWAIDAGYRHIDTAACYKNEVEVGEAIANKIKEGVVSREELFVTTKLWNDRHAEEQEVPTLKESLKKLNLEYVDLYLVHWPVSVDDKGEDLGIPHEATWRGMEAALQQGLTRSIGVSNFTEQQLDQLLKTAVVKPVVNQVEINPTLTAKALVKHCVSVGVTPVAYTPLGLISEARPEFAGLDTIKTDPRLEALAAKYGKSKAQIALRYLIQRDIVVLPKSFTQSRIVDNINLFDFALSESEMATVDGLNINHRCVPATSFEHLKNYPF